MWLPECYWISMKSYITFCVVLLYCLQGIGQNALLDHSLNLESKIISPPGAFLVFPEGRVGV